MDFMKKLINQDTVTLMGVEYWNDKEDIGDKSATTYELFFDITKAQNFKKKLGNCFALLFVADVPVSDLYIENKHIMYENGILNDCIVIEESKNYKKAT